MHAHAKPFKIAPLHHALFSSSHTGPHTKNSNNSKGATYAGACYTFLTQRGNDASKGKNLSRRRWLIFFYEPPCLCQRHRDFSRLQAQVGDVEEKKNSRRVVIGSLWLSASAAPESFRESALSLRDKLCPQGGPKFRHVRTGRLLKFRVLGDCA